MSTFHELILCLVTLVLCVSSLRPAVRGRGIADMRKLRGYDGKVVGGVPARSSDFPYLLFLKARNSGPMCGASIIGEYYALTAAHCLYGQNMKELPPEEFTLYAGVVDKNVRGAYNRSLESYVIHPAFSMPVGRNVPSSEGDIAVLRVSIPFTRTPTTKKLKMAEQNEMLRGNIGYLAGWGFVDQTRKPSDILMKTSLFIRPTSDCLKNPYYIFNPATMICAGSPTNSCQGDSGSPLVQGVKQIGIVSVNSGQCVLNAPPTIFTKISAYRDWIDYHMDNDSF